MKYSEYQKSIFREILTGNSNIAVISRAGVGKTATILESFKYIKPNTKSIALAFNRHIAKELKEKNKYNVEVYTLHSIGMRAISSRFSNVKVDNNKVNNILFKLLDKINYPMINEFRRAVSIAKMSLQDSPDQIVNFLDYYRIDIDPFTKEEFCKIVIQCLRKCKEDTKVIDFDDMIWFPFVFDLNIGKYDNIFVDECQDLNYAQLNMILKLKKQESRIFMFLDDKQAIYSFRCAHIKNVMNFIDKLNCKNMSLPITYRCPKKVVEFVKKYVDDYLAYEENIDGEIIEIKYSQLFESLEPNSLVLSRYNDPLIKLYFSLINNKIPAMIKGKDIGDNILSFIKKYKKKTIEKTINSLNTKLLNYSSDINSDDDLSDKIRLAISLLKECNSFTELNDLVKKIFIDVEDKNKVILSTVHSFKGGEKDNVYVLEDTLNHCDIQEEKNINYVAYTRAKKKLFLVKE